jgi:hypothetical protein
VCSSCVLLYAMAKRLNCATFQMNFSPTDIFVWQSLDHRTNFTSQQ